MKKRAMLRCDGCSVWMKEDTIEFFANCAKGHTVCLNCIEDPDYCPVCFPGMVRLDDDDGQPRLPTGPTIPVGLPPRRTDPSVKQFYL